MKTTVIKECANCSKTVYQNTDDYCRECYRTEVGGETKDKDIARCSGILESEGIRV